MRARELENLSKMISVASTPGHREIVLRHAELIHRASDESVPDESDRRDVRAAYDLLLTSNRRAWPEESRVRAQELAPEVERE